LKTDVVRIPNLPVSTARGREGQISSTSTFARVLMIVAIVLAYLFLYMPVAVMGLFSFNNSQAQTLPLKGFTTTWYQALRTDTTMQGAIRFSLMVSFTAVILSLLFGTLFALIVTRVRFPGLRIVQGLLVVPVVLPGMVLGVSLLLAFRLIGVDPGPLSVVTAHTVFLTPIVMFVVAGRLRTLDPSLEQASMDLGANRFKTFLNVTLPAIRISLIAAALLCFTVSFDEVAVTFFVTGFKQTLPVYIWTLLRFGFTPEVNAVLSIIATVSLVSVITAAWLLGRTFGRPRKAAA
jgi:ABC-type spermidine/putrescine transport system permease subunit II